MEGSTLDDVYRVVGECFPAVLSETIVCLSVAATLLLEDQQNPVALNLEGPPSSAKTTILDFFGDVDEELVYRSDKFTPKSFVSHATSVKREDLDKIDLLPRIRHKLFLVPELAPLFGLRAEDLLESFSILTRVLDGQGLKIDSGAHGSRGYSGDYLFAWLGCTTPIEHRVWKTMGKLGSRFLFIAAPGDTKSSDDLATGTMSRSSYRERLGKCRAAVAEFLDELWTEHGGVRGVSWDRASDPRDVVVRIADYARLLAPLRGTVSVWREGSGDDETYNFTVPTIEGPERAMSLLYALARGHALVHGRTQLTEDDLPIVARVALESTPHDRRAVMRLLIEEEGTVTTKNVESSLSCSRPTARAIMETLGILGIGEFSKGSGPVPASLVLADEFEWLLDAAELYGVKNVSATEPELAESDSPPYNSEQEYGVTSLSANDDGLAEKDLPPYNPDDDDDIPFDPCQICGKDNCDNDDCIPF